MFRRDTQDPDFWSRKTRLRDIDLMVEPTTEDIRPGSGPGWKVLWDRDGDIHDDTRWAEFIGGDTSKRREVRWLLGA